MLHKALFRCRLFSLKIYEMRDVEELTQQLQRYFGAQAECEGPLAASGAAVRILGIDLTQSLTPNQVGVLLGALSQFRIICVAGQDLQRFGLDHFERFANHWGAPVPHPNNFLRGGKSALSDGDSDGPFALIPFEQRRVAAVNLAFPGQLECLPHESPAVLVAANFHGPIKDPQMQVGQSGSWHTDIEYEPLPIYVSMFLCHHAPTSRGPGGTWVEMPDLSDPRPYLADSDHGLLKLRKDLPLNGETSFADTAAAFASLSQEEQSELASLHLRRRLNELDEGWLAPLVRTNPRSGIQSMHSPIFASRPGVRPPVQVDGKTMEVSRALLDRLESLVLQPQFRYDHIHVAGDVTIWDNYMTLHNSPPMKSGVSSVEDARLLYRLSCKGDPAIELPRRDSDAWLGANIPGSYRSPQTIVNLRQEPA